jgi:hypothetical protein
MRIIFVFVVCVFVFLFSSCFVLAFCNNILLNYLWRSLTIYDVLFVEIVVQLFMIGYFGKYCRQCFSVVADNDSCNADGRGHFMEMENQIVGNLRTCSSYMYI